MGTCLSECFNKTVFSSSPIWWTQEDEDVLRAFTPENLPGSVQAPWWAHHPCGWCWQWWLWRWAVVVGRGQPAVGCRSAAALERGAAGRSALVWGGGSHWSQRRGAREANCCCCSCSGWGSGWRLHGGASVGGGTAGSQLCCPWLWWWRRCLKEGAGGTAADGGGGCCGDTALCGGGWRQWRTRCRSWRWCQGPFRSLPRRHV